MKNLKSKIFVIILLSIVFSLLFINKYVMASTLADAKNNYTYGDEKILKYDAATGEVTEVDESQLLQIINNSGNEILSNAYNPLKLNFTKNNILIPYSTLSSSGYRVLDTTPFPYRTTCKIWSTFPIPGGDEGTVYASGSLVGPNVVLSCAHAIFNEDYDYKPNNYVSFAPGYNNGFLKDDTGREFFSGYSQIYFSSNYLTGDSDAWKYDWSVCILTEPLGEELGYFRSKKLR